LRVAPITGKYCGSTELFQDYCGPKEAVTTRQWY